jgi:hypothetical protein
MNMVLDGLETIIMNKFPRWKRQKVNFIRYADDFVITAIDKETITNEIIPLVTEFLAERGLELNHKGICSKCTFARLGTFIYWQLKRWAKYQHGNKNRWWIYHRYFHDNHFTDQRNTPKGIEHNRLYRIAYVPIRYHVKVKARANPFLEEYDKYFFQRTKWREDLAKECKQITTFMGNKNSS